MAKQVLYGRTYRIQIRVIDHSEDFDHSEFTRRFCAQRLSRGESLFSVSVYALHGMYDKYTSYSVVGSNYIMASNLKKRSSGSYRSWMEMCESRKRSLDTRSKTGLPGWSTSMQSLKLTQLCEKSSWVRFLIGTDPKMLRHRLIQLTSGWTLLNIAMTELL